MTTDAAITAALDAARALDISASDMVALIKRAIAAGLTDDGRIVVATSTRGTSISFGSLTEATNALKVWVDLAAGEAGPTASPGSFVCG
jgi:hypothetical protein